MEGVKIMKSKSLSSLTENDVLALDISTNDGCIVLSKGTLLNEDYIDKLKGFGIKEVFIEDLNSKDILKSGTNSAIDVSEARKNTLINYCSIFCDSAQNKQISKEKLDNSTTNVISTVLSKIDDKTLDILYRENPFFCHYTHSMNTASLAVFIGLKMELTNDQLLELATASLLHDIGMHKLPYEILEKSGNLDDDEVSIVKRHTIYGYETCQSIEGLSENCKKAILHHHERYDGKGYPFRMKGKDIPLYSRIIAVADIFCSLTTKTRTHPGYSYSDGYEFILAGSGFYFDPDVVEVFQKNFVIYPVKTRVRLNNGYIGYVDSQNPGFPDRPNVKITQDERGIDTFPRLVNLIRKTNLKIDEIVK